jgi:FkbM family methyltransferase
MKTPAYQSVGDTYKTRDKFAQLDQETFRRSQALGFSPQVIFDIGASDGSWSKDIVEVFPNAEFHLFEPLVDHAPAYKAIMAENLKQYPNFNLHKLALGDKEDVVTINIFPNLVASTVIDMDGSGLDVTPVQVPMTTIDALMAAGSVKQPQVIKVDTQGYELSILRGAVKTLPKVSVLLLECWLYRGYGSQTPLLTEIADWLRSINFRLWDIGDTYRGEDDSLATVDCVFINTQLGLTPSWYYE